MRFADAVLRGARTAGRAAARHAPRFAEEYVKETGWSSLNQAMFNGNVKGAPSAAGALADLTTAGMMKLIGGKDLHPQHASLALQPHALSAEEIASPTNQTFQKFQTLGMDTTEVSTHQRNQLKVNSGEL